MTEERLQKALARAGLGSRRAVEVLIREGRLAVNGNEATLGDKVDTKRDTVTLDGSRVPLDPDLRYFLFNKPVGVVTSMDDAHADRDLKPYLPEGVRVFPVGRLDRDTEGLLVLTNDGELANRLAHPRYGVEKEYLVEVNGLPTPADLALLRTGIELEDGPARALEVRQKGRAGQRTALTVVMGEGRKREVRRLFDAIGFPVVRLVRVRQGPLRLDRTPPGELRELTGAEVRALWAASGG
jgi:23S rRNA pseudouridine2605 synthase